MTPIRVLLAEDHETVRQGLRLLLESQADIEVIAEAANGLDAVKHCQTTQPQVVILDISMPEMNGLAAAKAIRHVLPKTAIVALTRHDDEAFVQELMAAGASGYVLKQSRSTELLNAVRAVAAGGQYLDALLARRASEDEEAKYSPRPATISDREKEVLRMMAVGHSNKGIAADLNISIKTVEVHKANAMRKLGLRGRIDVVRFAILHGWLKSRRLGQTMSRRARLKQLARSSTKRKGFTQLCAVFASCKAHDVGRDVRVLLVSDSRDEREMYAEWFRRKGYCTLQAATASDGLRLAFELAPDIVVTDIKLPGFDGWARAHRDAETGPIHPGPASRDSDRLRIRTRPRTGESSWVRSIPDQALSSGSAGD